MFRIAHALARPAAVTVGGCVGMSLIGPPPQARPLLRPGSVRDLPDDGRIAAILEDAITIRKAVTQAQELHKAGKLQDMHQFVRWVNTKEEHASKIMTTIAEYFLAQKVKKDQLSEHDYHEVLALHHAVMVAAMKAKQSSDMAAVDALDAAIA
eukprot:CAMPEP_0170614744 /NCGR_PEP_ID=MMETSP0224-20130122/24966_1 /TAXON_ID=285029 /ORGANISM="Togula jolla, Strain CCCM 725" /LENGTH=152 /DNA_ID=CAMNT_0010940427 /DNA_START=22 /DNA_END=477 /DNA_ORIENTATION=-